MQLSRRELLGGAFAFVTVLGVARSAEAIPTSPKEPRMFVADEQQVRQTAAEMFKKTDTASLARAARCLLDQDVGGRSAVVVYTGAGITVSHASRIAHQLSRNHDTEVYCVPIDQGANNLFADAAGTLEIHLLGTMRTVYEAKDFLSGGKSLRDVVPRPLPFSTLTAPHDGEGGGVAVHEELLHKI